MGLRILRNLALIGLGTASLGALSTLVVGWTQVASVPFTCPPNVGAVPKVWSGPPGTRVGIKVKVTAGEVRAEGPEGTPLGHVHVGAATVFEGNFPSFNVIGFGADASGNSTVRKNDTIGSADRLIGGDTLALPVSGFPNGSSYGIYASSGAQMNTPRLLTVKAGSGGGASVTDGSNTLLSIDAGDWSFCSKLTSTYRLASPAPTSVDWAVFDMPSATGSPLWSQSGTASAQTGDSGDAVYADGTGNICIVLLNNGPGDINVVSSGGTGLTSPLAQGQSTTVTGNVNAFSWTYTAPGTSVSITVKKP